MKCYSFCRRFIAFVLVVSIFILLVACSKTGDSSIDSAEKVLDKYSNLFMPITNWLCESEYNHIVLKSENARMFADFSYYQIPEEIKPMVEKLFHDDICSKIIKIEDYNVIVFQIWTEYPQRDSGIYFAIDKSKPTHIDYLTYMSPLSESGWYYYVVDFIKWEVNEEQGMVQGH